MFNEAIKNNKGTLEDRLNVYPILKARIGSLLEVVENADNEIEKADEAEQKVLEEIRKMGNEALVSWAIGRESKKSEEVQRNNPEANKHKKKPKMVYLIW